VRAGQARPATLVQVYEGSLPVIVDALVDSIIVRARSLLCRSVVTAAPAALPPLVDDVAAPAYKCSWSTGGLLRTVLQSFARGRAPAVFAARVLYCVCVSHYDDVGGGVCLVLAVAGAFKDMRLLVLLKRLHSPALGTAALHWDLAAQSSVLQLYSAAACDRASRQRLVTFVDVALRSCTEVLQHAEAATAPVTPQAVEVSASLETVLSQLLFAPSGCLGDCTDDAASSTQLGALASRVGELCAVALQQYTRGGAPTAHDMEPTAFRCRRCMLVGPSPRTGHSRCVQCGCCSSCCNARRQCSSDGARVVGSTAREPRVRPHFAAMAMRVLATLARHTLPVGGSTDDAEPLTTCLGGRPLVTALRNLFTGELSPARLRGLARLLFSGACDGAGWCVSPLAAAALELAHAALAVPTPSVPPTFFPPLEVSITVVRGSVRKALTLTMRSTIASVRSGTKMVFKLECDAANVVLMCVPTLHDVIVDDVVDSFPVATATVQECGFTSDTVLVVEPATRSAQFSDRVPFV
jgi:hypothetical protein